jgi:hypothetical protein
MKPGAWITITVAAIGIVGGVFAFTLRQSDRITRHDVRIQHLEESYSEVKDIKKDIACIKENLVRLTTILERQIGERNR